MSHSPVDSIGNGYASDHCWSVLEDLVAIRNRMAGHEGEKEGPGP